MNDDVKNGPAAANPWTAYREDLEHERADLLERIRAAGIAEVVAHYDGYGDSGDVNDITAGMDADLERAVSSFVWDFAYSRHPGFENNEGGQGVLTWDVEADSITLDHGDNYIETEQTLEEDL